MNRTMNANDNNENDPPATSSGTDGNVTRIARSQEARSREMRERLVESTLYCLQQHGYHGCSLSMILKHAGVSRGAWSHHFHSKIELVAAAARAILNHAVELARQEAAALKESGDFRTIVDFIWDNFCIGRNRDAWLEFTTACRTDTELRDRVLLALEDFQKALDDLWSEHLAPVDGEPNERMMMNMTICMLRGMAVQAITSGRPEYYLEMRKEWAGFLEKLLRLRTSIDE